MPLVYDITYNNPAFAGQSAVVRDLAESTVTGSPVTLDSNGNGQISLDEGHYKATASNTALGLNDSVTALILNVPDSIEEDAGGGGGGSADPSIRGTLYLKASAVDVDASMETWADGSGAPFTLVLDTEMQGDTPIPSWADETAGVYSIIEGGTYLAQIAGVGTVTFDEIPTLAYIDMYSNELSGTNYGWSSAGNENSEPFTPALENALLFGATDANTTIGINPGDVPLELPGLVGDNYGDITGNPVVSLEAKLSITKIGSGARYTSADFD